MTSDDAVQAPTTDAWGRPVRDGMPEFGPVGGDRTVWPAVPMHVVTDEDVVTCAAGFARAFTSEYFFTVWLIALDPDGWSTKECAELLDLPPRPPTSGLPLRLHDVAGQLRERVPGCSVVVAIARPAGGDRSHRELAWSRALLQAAELCGLPVRGVVAVGAHRARLLHSAPPPRDGSPDVPPGYAVPWLTGELPAGRVRTEADLLTYSRLLWALLDDPSCCVWVVPVDGDGEVCGRGVVVENLPAEPEPADWPGLADVVRDTAAQGPTPDRAELVVVLGRPTGVGVREEAWAGLVRDVAAREGVVLRGLAAVGPAGAAVLDPGTLDR